MEVMRRVWVQRFEEDCGDHCHVTCGNECHLSEDTCQLHIRFEDICQLGKIFEVIVIQLEDTKVIIKKWKIYSLALWGSYWHEITTLLAYKKRASHEESHIQHPTHSTLVIQHKVFSFDVLCFLVYYYRCKALMQVVYL